jgi:hypothetical protein
MTREELHALVEDLVLPAPAPTIPLPRVRKMPPPVPAKDPEPINVTRRKLLIDQRNIQERPRVKRPPIRATT